MIDLSQHELIPFKTRAKGRDGRDLTFVGLCDSYDGLKYRFLDHVDKDVYRVYGSGRAERDEAEDDHPFDVVSIARKWVPRNGDRVIVSGPIVAMTGQNSIASGPRTTIIVDEIEAFIRVSETEYGIYDNYHWIEADGIPDDWDYYAHRNNIRRAP